MSTGLQGRNADPEVLDAMVEAVRTRAQASGIVLHGSGARGEMEATSDIDLMVLTEVAEPEDLRARLAKAASQPTRRCDITVISPKVLEKGVEHYPKVLYGALSEGKFVEGDPDTRKLWDRATQRLRTSQREKTGSPPRFKHGDPRRWADIARSRLGNALDNNQVEAEEDTCALAHDAVERALKAMLMKHKKPRPHSHDIAALADLLEEEGKLVLPDCVHVAKSLKQYQEQTHWPSTYEPSEAEADDACENARLCVEWAEEKILTLEEQAQRARRHFDKRAHQADPAPGSVAEKNAQTLCERLDRWRKQQRTQARTRGGRRWD